jgi:hypothetical protein
MSYKINLDISPKKRVHGGVQLFLNWTTRADDPEQTEPAMIFRKAQGGRSIYVLPMSHLHNVMSSSGHGLLAIVATGLEIAGAIGFANLDRFAGKAVSDLILEYTDDLFQMFPEPVDYLVHRAMAAPPAELSVKIDGETVMEREVAL